MSLPQIDDAFIFSRTWPGPGSGTSTSTCCTVLSPGRTTPFMIAMRAPPPVADAGLPARRDQPRIPQVVVLGLAHGQLLRLLHGGHHLRRRLLLLARTSLLFGGEVGHRRHRAVVMDGAECAQQVRSEVAEVLD